MIARSIKILSVIRWLARIGSIASLGLIALFFFGEGFNPSRVAAREWIGLLFFPVGLALGMVLGWWHERLGGGIATASLLAFYFVYGLLLVGRLPTGLAFVVFGIPGILFLIYGIIAQVRDGEPGAAVSRG
jgi:hypothetical protein